MTLSPPFRRQQLAPGFKSQQRTLLCKALPMGDPEGEGWIRVALGSFDFTLNELRLMRSLRNAASVEQQS